MLKKKLPDVCSRNTCNAHVRSLSGQIARSHLRKKKKKEERFAYNLKYVYACSWVGGNLERNRNVEHY